MSKVKQSDEVRKIIGERGDRLSGTLVVKGELGVTVQRSVSFGIGSIKAANLKGNRNRERAISLVGVLRSLEKVGRAMDYLRTGRKEIAELHKCGELMRTYQAKAQILSAAADRLPISYRIHLSSAATELNLCTSCRSDAQEACDRAALYITAGEKAIREDR